MKQYIAPVANYTVAAALFILASIYLVKSSFMPYHSQAVSLPWNEIETSTQALILALMRVCGGGWLAVSLTTIFLQWHFSQNRLSWIPALILIIGLLSIVSTLYATSIVYFNTPGRPPIPGLFVLIFLLVVGYRLNVAEIKKYQIT
ncbi:hypothetical protein ACFSKU_21620 [Pontibacter silvestris]|uniref:Uncharacterized protein n=1 Tax=Pontibacter silvestris TaxID=2305183 RepID=A0ABW4X489_9BACT|nr:hypothetical protein [Pontibacter silvestris]MCC9138351.1 hypothetical protein [Pontibacter silvestris]